MKGPKFYPAEKAFYTEGGGGCGRRGFTVRLSLTADLKDSFEEGLSPNNN